MYRIGQEEINAVAEVIGSKMLFKVNNGLRCAENYEKEACQRFGVKHTILMTSGNAALISAMTALGIGPGDEVIVPAYTYIATAMAVVATGAIPVIAEVDETLTISPEDIEKKLSSTDHRCERRRKEDHSQNKSHYPRAHYGLYL